MNEIFYCVSLLWSHCHPHALYCGHQHGVKVQQEADHAAGPEPHVTGSLDWHEHVHSHLVGIHAHVNSVTWSSLQNVRGSLDLLDLVVK